MSILDQAETAMSKIVDGFQQEFNLKVTSRIDLVLSAPISVKVTSILLAGVNDSHPQGKRRGRLQLPC